MRTSYQTAHPSLDTMKVTIEDSWSGSEAPTFSITATCEQGGRCFESGCHVTVSARSAVTRFWEGEGSRRFYSRHERQAYRPLRREVESWIEAVVDTLDILIEGGTDIFLERFHAQLKLFQDHAGSAKRGATLTDVPGTPWVGHGLLGELAMFRLKMASLAYFYRIGKVSQEHAFPLLQDAHAAMDDLLSLPEGAMDDESHSKVSETKKHLSSITSLNKFLRAKAIA